MKRKSFNEDVNLYENVRIAKLNSDIKRLPIFSHYIWTHDIHSLERVKRPEWMEDEKPEDLKQGFKSQQFLERGHSTSMLKKEDHDDEEETKSKFPKKKTQTQRTLDECLEKIDNWHRTRPAAFVSQKVEELAREVGSQKKIGDNRDQELYNELFGSRLELMPATSKRNHEFIKKIKEIQEELRPGIQKLPSIYESLNVKQGSKNKPTKVSVEPSLLSNSRMKILQLKEIEMKQKINTSRGNLNKIPFSLHKGGKDL